MACAAVHDLDFKVFSDHEHTTAAMLRRLPNLQYLRLSFDAKEQGRSATNPLPCADCLVEALAQIPRLRRLDFLDPISFRRISQSARSSYGTSKQRYRASLLASPPFFAKPPSNTSSSLSNTARTSLSAISRGHPSSDSRHTSTRRQGHLFRRKYLIYSSLR